MPKCSLCGSGRVKLLWPVHDNRDYRVYSCGDCTGSFVFPQPSASFLRNLYSRSYYDAWGIDEESSSLRQMKLETFALRLELIGRYKRGGRILDVGCATGYFLEQARSAGFTPYGVEFSDFSSRVAQEKFGADAVFHGVLEDAPFPDATFDVIAMSDLLEHVTDPDALLEKTRRLLKEDGIVMIMTPDTASLTQRLMRDKWVHYKLEHLFYFNLRAIRTLAARHSFQLLHREKARKALNLNYFYHQFTSYRHWLLTPLFTLLHALLPKAVAERNFRVTVGEMVVVLKKSSSAE